MQALNKLSTLILLAAVLAGCSKEDGRTPLGPEADAPYENYVRNYIKPVELFTFSTPDQPMVETSGKTPFQITLRFNPVSGETYSGGVKYTDEKVSQFWNDHSIYPSLEGPTYKPEVRRVYDSLSTAHKDTEFNKSIYSTEMFQYMTVYRRMTLDIVSDTPYDAAHPAGASLADIITIRFPSAKEFIEDGYTWTDATKSLPHEEVNTYDGIILIKSLAQFNTENRKLVGGWFRFEFTKAPDATSTHTFTIIYLDEDGRELTTTMPPVTIKAGE